MIFGVSADKPFCFLAFCFEWLGYHENGDKHETHIPVSVDGSAAMGYKYLVCYYVMR